MLPSRRPGEAAVGVLPREDGEDGELRDEGERERQREAYRRARVRALVLLVLVVQVLFQLTSIEWWRTFFDVARHAWQAEGTELLIAVAVGLAVVGLCVPLFVQLLAPDEDRL